MTLQELTAEHRSLVDQFKQANAEGRHADANGFFIEASRVFRQIVNFWQANAQDEFERLLADLALASFDLGYPGNSADIVAIEQNTRPS